MKCIRLLSDGKLLRVPSFQALSMVESKLAVFISKEEYKAERGKK
jgi:hypothetical protein